MSFSPDEKFLLGCGGDRLVYVWDTSTGELVTGKQYSEPSTLGEWTGVKLSGRRPIYEVRVVLLVFLSLIPTACLVRVRVELRSVSAIVNHYLSLKASKPIVNDKRLGGG